MTNPHDPAYPNATPSHDEDGNLIISMDGGLTKREYFAGLAMQGIFNHSSGIERMDQSFYAEFHDHDKADQFMCNAIAKMAVVQADALIAELAKEQS